ncbi:MAG TPA: FAD-dependent monooxygenase [Stellaceae bacterium]|nr:FAD-dependent monooxygenase [Stellaceae bacterium]
MSSERPTIAVIGAGLGGLAAALALRRAGFAVEVFEQGAGYSEIGAGIQIGPNASRILQRLVPPERLARDAVRPVAVHQRRWQDGRTLQHAPLGDAIEAAFGAPYYHFHRADLLSALASQWPREHVHFRHRLTRLRDDGERVTAQFENGAEIAADLLIGADGIHSAVRAQLFGPEQPRFTGCIAYRGLVPAERLAPLALDIVAGNWMGPGQHCVHYFVSGGRALNFVGIIERDSWTRESWTDRGEKSDLRRAYEAWHPQVRAIIEAVDETFIWALFDRAPLPRWSVGRVTLLGDACHAMLPFMAQGAAQAIEDGASLAACLAQLGGARAIEALQLYERLRRPRATRLQELSRLNKTRFHLPDGPRQQERDAEMAVNGDRSIPAIAWLYAHDAGAVAAT